MQVLVSIQSLILVPEPYYNEPGLEAEKGTAEGEHASKLYNESARVLTLQIVLHSLSDPALASQPVVQQHYRACASRIIDSCAEEANMSTGSAGFCASMNRLLPELRETLGRL